MAEIKIIWHPIAIEELKEILDFYIWRNQSTSYSEKLLVKINKSLTSLQQFPLAAKNTDEPAIRYLLVDNNYIFYSFLEESKIYVLMLTDARKNPKTIKTKLQKRAK
jgi:plasmid stabilization system protein ParE